MLIRKEKKNHSWDTGKKMMKNPRAFVGELKNFDMENIDAWIMKEMGKIIAMDIYNFDSMAKKSRAAA